MKSIARCKSFAVLETIDGMQTASMRLARGQESGKFGNEHPGSPQVMLVVSGVVRAEIGGSSFVMHPGDSVIVPKHVAHRFVGVSDEPALTFNVYAPPAY